MSTRWYVSQLEQLPPDTRRRLSAELRRYLRAGSPPTRRQWLQTVHGAYGAYRTVA
ncbi:MAG: hypothetical protein ABIL09_14995 [Gemmatimonadota bacterium]